MPIHCYETSFEIGRKTVLVFLEYTLSAGCPAHYGSLNYPGHPAEPPELELVKVEINTTDADSKTAKAENYFPAPDWLSSILQNDDDLFIELCNDRDAHDYSDDYEYEGD